MPPHDILTELRKDHEQLRRLLTELEESSDFTGASRVRNLSLLQDQLSSHAELEAERCSELGLIGPACDGQPDVERLFGELAVHVAHAAWPDRLRALRSAIDAHISATEEGVLRPREPRGPVRRHERSTRATLPAVRVAGAGGGRPRPEKVRYAVVGLGHIAQMAVLPAFAHARRNSALAALVSDDPKKLAALGKQYRVELLKSYDEYDELLRSGEVDAVYIALPNDMHRDYAIRAAACGVHVLCEKPLATTAEDCLAMIAAAAENGVKLMTAYRLHFERANMKAVDLVQKGRIGRPRFFHSMFSMQVRDEQNIRLDDRRGGGPLLDLGVYCINAARYLFRDEPVEVAGMEGGRGDGRFDEVPEMFSGLLRFPGERCASFTCSFGAADVSMARIVGTKGTLELEPAYDYARPLEHHLTSGGRTTHKAYPRRDQFAPELLHFSECILEDREPEPSGLEGLADARVIDALREAARSGRTVRLGAFERGVRPSLRQARYATPVPKPREIRAQGPRD